MSPRSPHVLQRRAVAMPSHQSVQSPAESCRQTVVHSIICGMLPHGISFRPASPPPSTGRPAGPTAVLYLLRNAAAHEATVVHS